MSEHEPAPIRVSTIIPVYNGSATVAQAIDSALAQDFDGQEIIVVNDGSTDNTAEVLAGYGDRIRMIHQANAGVSSARNAGAAIARGEYLALLDADDVWLPHHLKSSVTALDADRAAVLCCSGFIPIEHGERMPAIYIERSPSLDELLRTGTGMLPSAIVMRAASFVSCGGFESRLFYFEDLYLWLLMREQGEFRCVHETHFFYRQPPFADRAEKYEAGRKPFIRLIRERYGTVAETMVAEVNRNAAQSLLQKALLRLDARDLAGALRYAWRSFRIRPVLIFELGLAGRIFRIRNLRRVTRKMDAN
ncbi:MAG: glycosyltransferase family A protein [Candidatus Binataceae bacterium]|jgi:glycosyltransferase involved in cell wall biosynthesis